MVPLEKAPKAVITGIEITHHRLKLDPPFRASWDTQPRTQFDAAVVRVHTDIGLTGFGSGDMRLGFAGHADAAERYLAQGFVALKIRFHRGDWRDDIKALEAVRARVGNKLNLMVDCNQGWRMSWDAYPSWSLKDAVQVARELERVGVY